MSLEFARNRHLILYGPYPALAQQPEQQQMIDSHILSTKTWWMISKCMLSAWALEQPHSLNRILACFGIVES